MARKSRKPEAMQASAPVITQTVYNTALYIRLSVMDSGKKDSESILNQQDLLERYVAEHPELDLKSVFVDNGESGAYFNRPAWNDLMRECRDGKINCIAVKDLSRVGRNYIETGELLEKILPLLGVRLIAVNDGYDNLNLTNGERLVSNLKNLVNDIYAKDISRKVISSVHTKQKNGEFTGAYAAYGYLKDEHNKNRIVVNPETASVVHQIFEWKAEGAGNAGICRRLEAQGIPAPSKYNLMKGILKNKKFEKSLWIPSTVAGILRNPVYIGHMAQGMFREALYESKVRRETRRDEWIIVENTHEPIITEELYDRANAVMDERKARYDETKGKYDHFGRPECTLGSLVFCADCGKPLMRHKLVYKSERTAVWAYECRTYKDQHMCSKKYVREEILTGLVYEAVRKQLEMCANVSDIIEKLNRETAHKSRLAGFDTEIETTEKELRRIASLRQAIYDDYAAKLLTISEYQFATEKYNADAGKLRDRLEMAERERAEYTQNSTPVNKWLAAFSRFMDAKELKSDMAQTLIERIEVSNRDRVEIIFKFRDEFAAISKYAEVA